MGEPDQVTRSLPPPSFTPPKGTQPHTSAYLWEGNRLLQEITADGQHRTYVFEPDSFIPMLRIDEEKTSQTLTDRRFNRMRPSIAPRKRHQAG